MSSPSRQRVVKVAIPVPLPQLFDYLAAPADPAPVVGGRVVVPFGARRVVGIVVATAQRSSVSADRLQAVRSVPDGTRAVLPPELVRLLEWCARYYKHPIGEVMANALPPALRRPAGRLAEPATWYALTGAGEHRLAAGPGRAPVQHAVLERLAQEPCDWPALRAAVPGASARVRAALIEQELIAACAPGKPAARVRQGPELTGEQQRALQAILATRDYRCHLLDGVTGSGKTEVYLRLIEAQLAQGKQTLVLVPEIGLTPQLVRRFRERLGLEPLLSHSGLSDGARLEAWSRALRGAPPLIIGTRSALFLPLENPGLIIMDESHDASFKQQDGFRFSARDVAVKRAADLHIPIVLGTATPSLETLHNAAQGRYAWHRLRQRATGAAQPGWRVTDLRTQPVVGGLAAPACEQLERVVARGEQALVFLNRRGYAPVLLCHDCGWHAGCARCDANLTWHQASRRLVCHHCDATQAVPRFCPECRADALQGAGAGTEQLEQSLAERFPDSRLVRIDRDTVRGKGRLQSMLEDVRAGAPCILIGTQMLAKGHHFPRVTLVVVVDLDQALYSADFRAIERMGQLLIQVAGRAGRAEHAGEVLVQTHHPDHPVLRTLLQSGYGEFAQALLDERRALGLPPLSSQAALRADAPDAGAVRTFLDAARAAWPGEPSAVFGPYPAMMERRAGRVRWYVLVQDPRRARLQALLDPWLERIRSLPGARKTRWTLDVDPQEF